MFSPLDTRYAVCLDIAAYTCEAHIKKVCEEILLNVVCDNLEQAETKLQTLVFALVIPKLYEMCEYHGWIHTKKITITELEPPISKELIDQIWEELFDHFKKQNESDKNFLNRLVLLAEALPEVFEMLLLDAVAMN